MLHNSSVSALKILHVCFHNPNLRNREWSNRYLQDQKFATSCDVTEWITTMLQPNTEIKRAASPIIHSARKCSSRFIWSAYVLSNPFPSKPSIVFSPQKPFYSQSNYSFWWLGILFSAYFEQFSRCKQNQGSVWDGPSVKPPVSVYTHRKDSSLQNVVTQCVHVHGEHSTKWCYPLVVFIWQSANPLAVASNALEKTHTAKEWSDS